MRESRGRLQARVDVVRESVAKRHICIRELAFLLPNAVQRSQLMERVCFRFGHKRLFLPREELDTGFPTVKDRPIKIGRQPEGPWSTPIEDQVAIARITRAIGARRVLEVGSYRGYTTLLLAENILPDGEVCAIDIDPLHGEAYRGLESAQRIVRFVGTVNDYVRESTSREPFDLIFLDADHTYRAVAEDTRSLMPLLGPSGVMIWHDYADWGWVSRWNRVPEVLHEQYSHLPLVNIVGTSLAVYRAR